MSHRGPKPAKQLIRVTHEPAVPLNWPDGHVAVVMTGLDQAEWIEITIHGVKHYLHSFTARELSNVVLASIDDGTSLPFRTACSRSKDDRGHD